MSVLKASVAAQVVRPFSLVSDLPCIRAFPSGEDDPVEGSRLAALRQENEALAAALADARAAAVKAHETGRCEGAQAVRQDEEKRLGLLQEALSGALARWGERLEEMDRLAPLIAHAALSKLFDDAADHVDFVTRAVARQLGMLRRDAVVAIRISEEDFPDEPALAAIAGSAPASAVLVRDPEICSGEARIDLTLGHIDLGLRSQWHRLAGLLRELSDG